MVSTAFHSLPSPRWAPTTLNQQITSKRRVRCFEGKAHRCHYVAISLISVRRLAHWHTASHPISSSFGSFVTGPWPISLILGLGGCLWSSYAATSLEVLIRIFALLFFVLATGRSSSSSALHTLVWWLSIANVHWWHNANLCCWGVLVLMLLGASTRCNLRPPIYLDNEQGWH